MLLALIHYQKPPNTSLKENSFMEIRKRNYATNNLHKNITIFRFFIYKMPMQEKNAIILIFFLFEKRNRFSKIKFVWNLSDIGTYA